MFRTLDRYIFRELLVPFVVGTASVVLMFLANLLMGYSDYLFRKEISWAAVGQLLLFSIPATLQLTLPVGTTIAVSLAISRLVRESELTAMRAAGIPIRRVLLSVGVAGLLIASGSFYLVNRVTPVTQAKFKDTLRKVLMSAEAIGVRSNVLLKFDEGRYHVSIGSIQKSGKNEILMNNVLVFHQPKQGEYWVAIANSAFYKEGLITLTSPQLWRFEGKELISFEVKNEHVISQRVGMDEFFGDPLPEEQTLSQLRSTATTLRARGVLDEARNYEVEYQNRFAIPFSCLVFALVAPVFALRFARGGAFVGVMLSIILVFAYYNLWIITAQVLAKKGILPPVVGCWLPNVLFLLAAMIAIRRAE